MREIPRPGERYRHFKNRDYQIVALARHSETGEWMVVYQALYGDFGVWVRPLSMFLEPVDRKKYPDAQQRFRFERVAPPGTQEDGKNRSEYAGALSPLLSEFLDTDSLEKRLEILQRMRGRVGRREVESLCFCLDVKLSGETVEEQLENLAKSLRMQQRYDASRLRR